MSMKKINMIMPAACSYYADKLPAWFKLDDNGIVNCINNIKQLSNISFSNIYITITKQLDDKFNIKNLLTSNIKFANLHNIKVVVIDKSTSETDTVLQTIKSQHIKSGTLFIKDADCMFTIDANDFDSSKNSIVAFPIEKLSYLTPYNKSYLTIDDMNYITNIIEKKVVGNYINTGGYLFSNINTFVNYAEKYINKDKLHLSNIVYAMMLDNYYFNPIIATYFFDGIN